jgi:hypothetical protein
MYVLPKWGKYEIRTEVIDIDDNGANTHRLVQVPLDEVAHWDATHDEQGILRHRNGVPAHDSDEAGYSKEVGLKNV